jgi:septal ring-binding cell division protein DamX
MTDTEKKTGKNSKVVRIIWIVIAALAIVLIGVAIGFTAAQQSDQPESSQSDEIVATAEASTHEHNWNQNYELKTVEAVTHTVDHPAVWETQTTYHTVCNSCQEIIDGEAVDHIAASGHSGYSTNVPIANDVKVEEAWTETVVDEPAHDELVVNGEICTICGATR